MNGKHYDAEVMLTHSYSVSREDKEVSDQGWPLNIHANNP